MEEKDKQTIIQNLCLYFFICSFIGCVCEILYAFYVEKTFVKRGFLYGIACPIYGFGAVMLIIINDLISKKTNSILFKMIIMAMVFTAFEYLVSLVFELIFGIRWWDYSNEFLNLHGRICLQFSILWGIAGGIFIQFIYKPMQKLIKEIRNKVSNKVINIVLVFLTIIMSIDFVLSVLKYLK